MANALNEAGASGPTNDEQSLPPGWESKYDPQSGRKFYVNHNDQTTSWECPQMYVNSST